MNRVEYFKPKQNYDGLSAGFTDGACAAYGRNPIGGSMNAGDQKSTGIQNICFPLELKHQTSLAWGFPVYWRGWCIIRLQAMS